MDKKIKYQKYDFCFLHFGKGKMPLKVRGRSSEEDKIFEIKRRMINARSEILSLKVFN